MGDFYLTGMGHKFYEGTLPKIANALASIAKALDKSKYEQRVSTSFAPYLPEEVDKILKEGGHILSITEYYKSSVPDETVFLILYEASVKKEKET